MSCLSFFFFNVKRTPLLMLRGVSTMFAIRQMVHAHASVKSGVNCPNDFQELKELRSGISNTTRADTPGRQVHLNPGTG
ncbi:MAG: hypothetical protein INR73_06735 [Williamsia sp.]|nr:hypothetical protein [Williamsia sp.]